MWLTRFDLHPLGPRSLPGVSQTHQVWPRNKLNKSKQTNNKKRDTQKYQLEPNIFQNISDISHVLRKGKGHQFYLTKLKVRQGPKLTCSGTESQTRKSPENHQPTKDRPRRKEQPRRNSRFDIITSLLQTTPSSAPPQLVPTTRPGARCPISTLLTSGCARGWGELGVGGSGAGVEGDLGP